MPVTLEISRDSEPSDERQLEGELTIGRDSGADLSLNDDGVSRRHARLRLLDGDSPVVEDLGSSNGTFVNGEPVRGTRPLAEGDELQVGATEIVIRGAGRPTEVFEAPRRPERRPAARRRGPDPGGREGGFNWPAIAALGLGALSLLLIFTGSGSTFYTALPFAIAAIVLGVIGRRAADRGQGLRGAATAGRVLGVIGTVIAVLAIVALLVVNTALDAGAESLGGLIEQLEAEIDGFSVPEEIPAPPGGEEQPPAGEQPPAE